MDPRLATGTFANAGAWMREKVAFTSSWKYRAPCRPTRLVSTNLSYWSHPPATALGVVLHGRGSRSRPARPAPWRDGLDAEAVRELHGQSDEPGADFVGADSADHDERRQQRAWHFLASARTQTSRGDAKSLGSDRTLPGCGRVGRHGLRSTRSSSFRGALARVSFGNEVELLIEKPNAGALGVFFHGASKLVFSVDAGIYLENDRYAAFMFARGSDSAMPTTAAIPLHASPVADANFRSHEAALPLRRQRRAFPYGRRPRLRTALPTARPTTAPTAVPPSPLPTPVPTANHITTTYPHSDHEYAYERRQLRGLL